MDWPSLLPSGPLRAAALLSCTVWVPLLGTRELCHTRFAPGSPSEVTVTSGAQLGAVGVRGPWGDEDEGGGLKGRGTHLIYFVPIWVVAKCAHGRGDVWLRRVRARAGVGQAGPGRGVLK